MAEKPRWDLEDDERVDQDGGMRAVGKANEIRPGQRIRGWWAIMVEEMHGGLHHLGEGALE